MVHGHKIIFQCLSPVSLSQVSKKWEQNARTDTENGKVIRP